MTFPALSWRPDGRESREVCPAVAAKGVQILDRPFLTGSGMNRILANSASARVGFDLPFALDLSPPALANVKPFGSYRLCL